MKKEKRKVEELDTETTFADMNVDGFRWYDPAKKKGKGLDQVQVTKKEYRSMIKGALSALVPVLIITVLIYRKVRDSSLQLQERQLQTHLL